MMTDDIALTLQPMIGPSTAAHLLACFGTAENIFMAPPAELVEKARLNPKVAAELVKKKYHKQAEDEIRFCRNFEITPIASTSDLYPRLLRECQDYPHVIYYKGDPQALSGRMLSMVGTRDISSYGQKACYRLVSELAGLFPDTVVVSGLAFGVDAACHRAAIDNGLRTIGIIANQFPCITPAQHTLLAAEIIKRGGGILTEHHSQYKNYGTGYKQRNRIIAGISAGTVVVEAPMKSGAMNTARTADGYHRSVMAVPGRIGDTRSEGTNYLIRTDSAVMVCSGEDIARELMWDIPDVKERKAHDTSSLSREAAALLEFIKDGEMVSIDELAELSGYSIAEVAPLAFELELNGAVRMLPGKMYEKA